MLQLARIWCVWRNQRGDSRMNITYVSSSKIPSREANSVHVMRMCQAFVRNGHEVTLLVVRSASGKSQEDDYAYYGVDHCFEIVKCPHLQVRWVGSALHALCAIGTVALRPRADLFYARYAYNLAALSFFGVPMILEVHNIPSRQQVIATLNRLFGQPHFVRLVAISEALALEYQRIFPELSPNKIVVAHDGADVPEIASDLAPVDWPGRPEALQVGYTGHLYPGRGIEIIVALATALPDVDFHIVGGTNKDVAKWRGACCERNLFFHGYIAPSEVAQRCSNFDVLLAPYQDDVATAGGRNTVRWMSPLKIFEYMASDKAIVCSDLPVLREVLTNQVNALLVSPADPVAWVQAVSWLKENPALRASLGHAAKEEFLTRYTWEKRAAVVVRELDLQDNEQV